MEQGEFHGERTLVLTSEHLQVEVLAEAGPRIVRVRLAGSSENVLGEVPDIGWETPWGEYHLRGGHRLWSAPENPPLTSAPDEGGLIVTETANGVRLERLEPQSSLRKSIEIELAADAAQLTLRHELSNEGEAAVSQAPWGITILPLGGVAILPQQRGAVDGNDFLPNRSLILWPYSSIADPRLELDDELVLIRATEAMAPFKIGYFNRAGWAGYVRGDVFLCKRFEPQPDRVHADLGSNVEVYCDKRLLELETLAPLATLERGERAVLTERWDLHRVDASPAMRAGIRELISSFDLS